MTDPTLDELHTRIAAGARKEREPPPPEGSKPILPVAEYLENDDLDYVWEAVRRLRAEHPSTARRLPEDQLALAIIDEVALMDAAPTLADLAAAIDLLVDAEGPWLVSTPLANITLAEPVMQLADDAVLWRTYLSDDWLEDRFGGEHDNSEFELTRLLKDRLPRPTRWIKVPQGRATDTRRGATLLTVEEGGIALALPRARAKAQYAVAVWATLAPPTGRRVLPDVGVWVPQPYLRYRQEYKRTETTDWITHEPNRGGGVDVWPEYEAPEPDILRVPFEAIANRNHRCCQALLSSSLALFQASRRSRFQLSEQLRNAQTAIEVLCERAPGEGAFLRRWERLADRFQIWDRVRHRGHSDEDIARVQTRVRDARNVATHGADAVLIDLDYPGDQRRRLRGAVIEGDELAFSSLDADLSLLRFAIGEVLGQLWPAVRLSNWDDGEFERQFA